VRDDPPSRAVLADRAPEQLSEDYRRRALPELLQRELETFLERYGHRAIAERNAADLYRALLGLRAATCAQLDSQASRTGEDIVADGRSRNRAYDVETKHGQTQGVVLGP